MRTWTGLLAIVGGLVCFAPALAAQELVLPGQVLDAAARPVAGLEVMLHLVAADGGALVAQDTTDADGRFELRGLAADGEPLYFVAARYEGELQIGPVLRSPFPAGDDYVLRVGGDPSDAAAAAAGAPTPRRDRSLALIPIAVLLIVGALAMTRAGRPPMRRRLLLRLAEIEEARAAGDGGVDLRERGRILARLRRGPST